MILDFNYRAPPRPEWEPLPQPNTDWYWQCEHSNKRATRDADRNGRTIYRLQCRDCGRSVNIVSKAVAAADWGCLDNVPPFDDAYADEMRAKVDRAHEEWRERQDRKRQQHSAEWWDWYNAYLDSPAWKAKRKKVLERAKWRCEGCDSKLASQVHHKTYDHVGDELLFELVALCDDCHDKVHG